MGTSPCFIYVSVRVNSTAPISQYPVHLKYSFAYLFQFYNVLNQKGDCCTYCNDGGYVCDLPFRGEIVNEYGDCRY